MDDLISRQAAIDAIDEQIEQCNKSLSSFDISMKDDYAVKVERASLVAFREILEYLPSAQLGTNLAEVGTDCINRQTAIDRATKEHDFYRGAVTVSDKARRDELLNVMCWLGELPSAQPAIVPCNYVEACNVATMDKSISAYTYLSVLADLKDHGFVLVDMREVTE